MGERPLARQRAARTAVLLVAAATCAVGKPSRRVRLWARIGRPVRVRCLVECGASATRAVGGALDRLRHRRSCRLLCDALRLGFDPGVGQDSVLWGAAAPYV